jgi:hypothetical protein
MSERAKQRMGMSMRKGILAAEATREAKRRREARENGIVLERETKGRGRRKHRDGGGGAVDLPAVGRMRGAELRLSSRDIKSVEGGGPRRPMRGSSKRGRRR